jgi:hypothetical protein
MTEILNQFSSLVQGTSSTLDNSVNAISNSINRVRDSIGFVEINDSANTNGLKVVKLVDEPFSNLSKGSGKVYHFYFSPITRKDGSNGKDEPIRFIAAQVGEPVTYREVRPTDIELKACAKNGTLILVLPDECPLLSSVKINRVDDSNHQMRVVAENAQIDGKEKINIPSNEEMKSVTLTKTENDKWTTATKENNSDLQ